jgi:hypothetical protein
MRHNGKQSILAVAVFVLSIVIVSVSGQIRLRNGADRMDRQTNDASNARLLAETLMEDVSSKMNFFEIS